VLSFRTQNMIIKSTIKMGPEMEGSCGVSDFMATSRSLRVKRRSNGTTDHTESLISVLSPTNYANLLGPNVQI